MIGDRARGEGNAPGRAGEQRGPLLDPVGGGVPTIAVVSDTTGHTERVAGRSLPSVHSAVWTAAALVEGLTGIRAVPVILDPRANLVGEFGKLPPEVAAIFLTGTEVTRARAVRLERNTSGPPITTDEDCGAVAYAAAVLNYLIRAGRTVRTSAVFIAGARRVPGLGPLLAACGVADITTWDGTVGPGDMLQWITRDAAAVIDLLGGPVHIALTQHRHDGSVIILSGTDSRFLAAPGLLKAAAESSPGAVRMGVAVLRAFALSDLTAAGYRLPDLTRDRAVVTALAAAAAGALDTA